MYVVSEYKFKEYRTHSHCTCMYWQPQLLSQWNRLNLLDVYMAIRTY